MLMTPVHACTPLSSSTPAHLLRLSCLLTPPDLGMQKYASPLSALQGIIKEEGVSALFRGLPLTCAKQGPSQAVLFLAFDSFKGVLDIHDR